MLEEEKGGTGRRGDVSMEKKKVAEKNRGEVWIMKHARQ